MSPLNNVMLVTCEVVEHREMILMTFWIGAFNCKNIAKHLSLYSFKRREKYLFWA